MRPATRPELHEVPRPTETMKALVYKGPGKRALEEKLKPVFQESTDAILKVHMVYKPANFSTGKEEWKKEQ